MYPADLIDKLISRFPDAKSIPVPEKFVRDPAPMVKIAPKALRDVCKFIKTDRDFLMDLPNFMTAVDYIKEDRFEMVYYFYSTQLKKGLILKSDIPRKNPEIDSITDLWNG